ncbi:hypothetical protein KP509_1Z046000 [Ceratopteris richardii]|nr:hypothetical protein KP509_1Z046000 [Ceratopteris richardii]
MAPLALAAGSSVSGLASTSFSGQKLQSTRVPTSARFPNRLPAVSAKYGEKSVYFDLEDIGNTTGNWDLYGSDAPSPYNGLQSKFFETFGGAFTKRGLLLKFLLLGGGGTLAYVSSSASGDLLPIKNGPQQPPKPGPRGKI